MNALSPGMDVGGGAASAHLAQDMLAAVKDIKAGHLTDGARVDYGAIRAGAGYAGYRALAARLACVDPGRLAGVPETLAFWINIYNALVMDAIIVLGVKGSVKEVTGFYKRLKYRVGEYEFSLDDIEHGILRANSRRYMRSLRQFGPFDARRSLALEKTDPRIHFALVCGASSCPPIKFYTPGGIDSELDMAAASFINSPEVVVNASESTLSVSRILKWYAADFGGRKGVLDFIARYLDDEEAAGFIKREGSKLKLKYLTSDWNLN